MADYVKSSKNDVEKTARILVVEWEYDYDKESTWFDSDQGTERYWIEAGTSFPLPHMIKKRCEILSVIEEGAHLTVELKLDYQTVTVRNDGERVPCHVDEDYMAAGDSVSTHLALQFYIE